MLTNIGLVASANSKKSTAKTGTATTQTQKVANKDSNMQADLKTKLDTLVKSNTINQSQEDKIIAGYKAIETARIAEMNKVNKMTEAERKTYFESKTKTQAPDVLANLVKDGTITQAQSDAIKAVFPGKGPAGFGGPRGRRGNQGVNNGSNKQSMNVAMEANMKTQLDTLVKAATITQAQEDNILLAYKANDTARIAEMTKLKAMTDAERKTYLDSQTKAQRPDVLANLVSAGTLTQAQSDAVKAVIHENDNHHGFGGPGGRGMNRQ